MSTLEGAERVAATVADVPPASESVPAILAVNSSTRSPAKTRCVCESTNPGTTHRPAASSTSSAAGEVLAPPIQATVPFSTTRSTSRITPSDPDPSSGQLVTSSPISRTSSDPTGGLTALPRGRDGSRAFRSSSGRAPQQPQERIVDAPVGREPGAAFEPRRTAPVRETPACLRDDHGHRSDVVRLGPHIDHRVQPPGRDEAVTVPVTPRAKFDAGSSHPEQHGLVPLAEAARSEVPPRQLTALAHPSGHAVAVTAQPSRRIDRLAESGHADHADGDAMLALDRKSTRLNSSHLGISYAVF